METVSYSLQDGGARVLLLAAGPAQLQAAPQEWEQGHRTARESSVLFPCRYSHAIAGSARGGLPGGNRL